MKQEELERCISDLPTELQEKVRVCKDMNDIYALIAENDVELSDDALEAVAGGCDGSTPKCTKCGATMKWKQVGEYDGYFYCPNCDV